MNIEKVAVYIRLSKEDIDKIYKGDDSESVKNQKLMLSEYTAKNGWQLFDFYIDEDYSGADRNRPEFERLLKDAEKKEFDIVLCKTQSRFVRDMEKLEEIIHGKFYKWGIRFISLLDGADTSVEGNKKSRQIHGLIDEWYLEDASKNIRGVLEAKMEDGQYIGSFAPYGYMKDPKDRHKLIIDKEAAKVVKRVFALYLEGYGVQKISKILTSEGIDRPSTYMKKKYKEFKLPNVSKHSLWGHTTIRRMLRNPIYIGTMTQGKDTTVSYKDRTRIRKDREDWIIVKNTHEAIIDEKDFYEVQKLLDLGRRTKKEEGKTHVFATKVRCLHCGGSMIRSTTRTRNKQYKDMQYAYLKCKYNTQGGNLICKYLNRISYTDLYNYVDFEFKKVMGLYKENRVAKEATIEQIKTINYDEEIKSIQNNLNKTEKNISAKAKALADLYLDKTKGIVSEEDYISISKIINEDRTLLEKRKKQLIKNLAKVNKIRSQKADTKKAVDNYLKNHKLTHEIVLETIDYIEIGSNEDEELEDGQNRIINIYWKL